MLPWCLERQTLQPCPFQKTCQPFCRITFLVGYSILLGRPSDRQQNVLRYWVVSWLLIISKAQAFINVFLPTLMKIHGTQRIIPSLWWSPSFLKFWTNIWLPPVCSLWILKLTTISTQLGTFFPLWPEACPKFFIFPSLTFSQ